MSEREIELTCAATRIGARFGETAVSFGFLGDADRVQRLLWFQRSQQPKLGQFFIERGMLNVEELEALVRELHQHNARIRFGRMARRGF